MQGANSFQAKPFITAPKSVESANSSAVDTHTEEKNASKLPGLTQVNLFAGAASSTPSPSNSAIQKKSEPPEQDELESAPDSSIQTKLTIGQSGDKYEQEADRMAAQVVSMPEPTVQRSTSPLVSFMKTSRIQRKETSPAASTQFEQQLNQTKGNGADLDKNTRSFMEPRFGADFSHVRVHTDATAVQMNREVNAQAFTYGNDIYFNSGKYSPHSTTGKELLAHELTHVIQQSSDNLSIQRDDNEATTDTTDDTAWATATKTAVERIQDAVPEAVDRLNTDAEAAIGHITRAQEAYNQFDRDYESAVAAFVSGVEAAQAREEEFRKNVKFVATSLLAVQAPLVSSMYGAIDGVLSKVERVGSIAASTTTPRAPADASGGSSPAMAARRENRVDWSELLSTTLTAFRETLKNNATLNSLSRTCVQTVRFLDNVEDGDYEGSSPQTSPNGVRATRMADNVTATIRQLSSIGNSTISGPTETMANQVAERLGGITVRKLQQDIAIRWIAGLPTNKRDEIDTADAYLREIGVIDSQGNRLGYNTGNITTDVDERIIHWRAQWENLAMELMGSTVTWLGNPRAPRAPINDGTRCIEPKVYSGRVRDNRNREWNVSVPRGATPEGGGTMLLQSYTVDHRDSSGWEWRSPRNLRQLLQYEILFTALPRGPLGGGAPAMGPVIHN